MFTRIDFYVNEFKLKLQYFPIHMQDMQNWKLLRKKKLMVGGKIRSFTIYPVQHCMRGSVIKMKEKGLLSGRIFNILFFKTVW